MNALILAAAITPLVFGASAAAVSAGDPNPNGAQTDFDVTKHGFDFKNGFSGDILIDLPLIGRTNFGGTFYGLCGGMSFAALDNFNLDCKAPDGLGQPVSGSEMQSYLYSRQDDSFRNEGGFLIRRLIEWTTRPIETKGRTGLHVLSDRQFKRIIAPAIDAGYPVPICIINAEVGDDVTTNHQVLAIGYRLCPETTTLKRHWAIDIYDSNQPDKVCTLHYSDSGRGLTLKYAGGTGTALNVDLSKDKYSGLRGFFVVPYNRRTPYWCTASAGAPIKGGAIVVKEDPIGDTPEGDTPTFELPDIRLPGSLGGDRRGQGQGAEASAPVDSAAPVNALRALLAQIEVLEKMLADATTDGGILAALPADAMKRLDEIRPLLERLSKLDAQISGATAALSKIASSGGKPSGPGIADDKPLEADPCCSITPNPELKGRLGRVVVKFPEGTKTLDRAFLCKAGEPSSIANDAGGLTTDAMPGQYAILLNGRRIEGIEVLSGHDTNIHVGVLRVVSLSGTARMFLYEVGSKESGANTSGPCDFGLLPGRYEVELLGQREAVTVKAGEITEY